MHKIFSYLLLCIGLLLILFALLGMYKVFVVHSTQPSIVTLVGTSFQTPYGTIPLPTSSVNTLANLILFAFFMVFLVFTGGMIARIGAMLLKNERIYDALHAAAQVPAQSDLRKL